MRFVGICSLFALAAALSAPPASAQSCDEYWYQRNMIYKEAGYCFTTPRAIRAFGNAGCKHDALEDVPLSARDRAEVAQIRAVERAKGCTP